MSKGTKNERKAQAILDSAGYRTYRPATVQFGDNDVYGHFDILAVNDLGQRWVQVKSNQARGRRTWFEKTALWRTHGVQTEMWVRHDREGWRVIQPAENGSTTVVFDGRDSAENIGDGLLNWLCARNGIEVPADD